ncbi:MAG: hypothetical protein ACREQI_03350 [Candidatus Binataceae bacterium]
MKIAKLAVPAFLFALIALIAPRAQAQTGAEYGAAMSSAGTGAEGAGNSMGSQTWGTSSVGAGFSQRAGTVAGSNGLGNGQSRWPKSGLSGQGSGSGDRFAASKDRFAKTDQRFGKSADLGARVGGAKDRFSQKRFGNSQGLDQHYSAINSQSFSRSGLDSGGQTSNP